MMLRSCGGSLSLRISKRIFGIDRRHDDGTLRVVGSDHLQGGLDERVPPGRRHFAARLIEKLEHCRGKSAGVVIRKLLPESQQLDAAIVRISLALIVVVFVDDGNEIVGNGLFQHPIEPRQYSQIEIVSAVHIFERGQIDPHVMESGIANHLEITLLERGIDAAVPNAVITENIDAAGHLPRHGCGFVLGCAWRGRRQNARQDDNRA